MMVIRVTVGNNRTIYPADRCTWQQQAGGTSSAPGQYEIHSVTFYPGNAAGVDLSTAGNVVELGQIGKSGRFVPITNAHTEA